MKVGIIGATGYTGAELLRLLTNHPKVEVVCITSQRSAGKPLIERLPFLKGHYPLRLKSLNPEKIAKKVDLVFIALSHTKAVEPVHQFFSLGKKVIDLSADYRFSSGGLYKKWYRTTHPYPYLLKKRVYGLSEVHRDQIAASTLLANPGCYPTGTLLPILPFLKKDLVDSTREIIIDAKSGVSGAGRIPNETTHFPEVNEGITAYNIGTHRHLPEIEQEIFRVSKVRSKILFTPYLLPVNRGILTTIYLPLNTKMSQRKLNSVLKIYRNEPFIRLIEPLPNINYVRGSNYCDISVSSTPSGRMAILISAIDNLVKGAAGQAIQNMNIMMGWEERLGLTSPGFFP